MLAAVPMAAADEAAICEDQAFGDSEDDIKREDTEREVSAALQNVAATGCWLFLLRCCDYEL